MEERQQHPPLPPSTPTPPPPYTDNQTAMATTSTANEQTAIIPPARPDLPLFPREINGYSHPNDNHTIILGEHRSSPLFAVTMPLFARDQTIEELILYQGSSRLAPVLAKCTGDAGLDSKVYTISLPPDLGSERIVILRREGSWKNGWTFSFGERDVFEWRFSSGSEIRNLGGSTNGGRLVRAGTGDGGGQGGEVLAVWARYSGSWSKFFKFAFCGAGKVGSLGPRWELLALLSALVMWDWDRRDINKVSS